MTDRAIVEEAQDRLWLEKKKETADDKGNVVLNGFKCAVHPLIQFQEAAEKEINQYEKEESSTGKGFRPRGIKGARDLRSLIETSM